MASRLSELLERMRPSGAVDGEQSLEQLAAAEVAELAEVLRASEDEADQERSRARLRAQRIGDEAAEQARRIRDDLPDRLAAAHVVGTSLLSRQRDAELSRIADETTREIDRLEAQAEVQLSGLVDAAVAHIWVSLEIEQPTRGGS